MRVKTFQVSRDQLAELESQINQFTNPPGNNNSIQVERIDITPIYTTITEDNILQGFLGVVTYT